MAAITNIPVYLQPGETYTFYIPVTMENNMGYFPRRGVFPGTTTEFKQGFYVENTEVGDIVHPHEDKVAVDYRHKLPKENTIWFHAATGERVRIMVLTVPVHDHSSIITGGPAYGTYFTGINTGQGNG